MRVQDTLRTLYQGVGGEYHAGEDAWAYVKQQTGFDLKEILINIAKKNTRVAEESAIITSENAGQVTLEEEHGHE